MREPEMGRGGPSGKGRGLAVGFTAAAVLAAVLSGRGPQGRPDPGRDAGPDSGPVMVQVLPPQAAMERRIRAKVEAAEELARGAITLAEAAGRFRELTEPDPEAVAALRRAHGPVPEEELFGRNAIDFVRAELRDDPDRLGAVVARLEAELRESHRRGTVAPPG